MATLDALLEKLYKIKHSELAGWDNCWHMDDKIMGASVGLANSSDLMLHVLEIGLRFFLDIIGVIAAGNSVGTHASL